MRNESFEYVQCTYPSTAWYHYLKRTYEVRSEWVVSFPLPSFKTNDDSHVFLGVFFTTRNPRTAGDEIPSAVPTPFGLGHSPEILRRTLRRQGQQSVYFGGASGFRRQPNVLCNTAILLVLHSLGISNQNVDVGMKMLLDGRRVRRPM